MKVSPIKGNFIPFFRSMTVDHGKVAVNPDQSGTQRGKAHGQ
jgi:hypothetical protein